MSERMAHEMAVRFESILQHDGVLPFTAGRMALELVGAGVVLADLHMTEPRTAWEAIAAGLVGEPAMLKPFSVGLLSENRGYNAAGLIRNRVWTLLVQAQRAAR